MLKISCISFIIFRSFLSGVLSSLWGLTCCLIIIAIIWWWAASICISNNFFSVLLFFWLCCLLIWTFSCLDDRWCRSRRWNLWYNCNRRFSWLKYLRDWWLYLRRWKRSDRFYWGLELYWWCNWNCEWTFIWLYCLSCRLSDLWLYWGIVLIHWWFWSRQLWMSLWCRSS